MPLLQLGHGGGNPVSVELSILGLPGCLLHLWLKPRGSWWPGGLAVQIRKSYLMHWWCIAHIRGGGCWPQTMEMVSQAEQGNAALAKPAASKLPAPVRPHLCSQWHHFLESWKAAASSPWGWSHMSHQASTFLVERELLAPHGLTEPLSICAVIPGVLKPSVAVPLILVPTSSSAAMSGIGWVCHTAKAFVLVLVQVSP